MTRQREVTMSDYYSDSWMVSPWNVVEDDFPATSTAAEQVKFLLNYAVIAPSRHNVQPWLFKIEKNVVAFYADRSRALPAADPEDREMIIGCGAALTNFLLAARHYGFVTNVEIHRDPGKPDFLARISLEKGWVATPEEQKLFHAIKKRRTNRQLFQDRAVPAALLSRLEEIAAREAAIFQVVQAEEDRYRLASLIAAGDHMLWEDEGFREEIARWTRREDIHSLDGVPDYAHGSGDMASYLGPLRIRTFMEREETKKEHHMAAGSPVFAVVLTYSDTRFDWLAAGQAIEKIVLYARSEGVWTSYFSQPVEIDRLRKDLQDILGRREFPQLVLRMGYGPEVPPTARRNVSEVIL